MKSRIPLNAAIAALAFASLIAAGAAPAAETIKQPIFLLCPHTEHFSAWSIYLTVDKDDPSKVISLGLDKMNGKNSEDLKPNGYDKVLHAQSDPSTQTENVGSLDAKDFQSGMLEVKKDNALKISMTTAAGGYRLMLSMRISADKRFVIGGNEQSKRDVMVTYDTTAKKWSACALTLLDEKGSPAVSGKCKPISGIVFPVTGTGIYRVFGVLGDGEAITLLDR